MKKLKSVFIFILAFLFTVVIFDFFFTFTGLMVPIVKIDSEKGERYLPNKTCCSISSSEGFGLAETNASGWFGKDFSEHASSDISIAVIGNSFVASRQVFYRDNFLSIAENLLNENSLQKFSFYNFGKESMPLTELLYIKEEIAKAHDPKQYLILINHLSFSTATRVVPYYKLVDDSLCLDLSFKDSKTLKLYNQFQFLMESPILFLGYRVKNKLPQWREILLDKFYFPTNQPQTFQNQVMFTIPDTDKAIIEKLAEDEKVIFLLDLDPDASAKIKSLIPQSKIIDLHPTFSKLKEQGIDPNFWEVSNVQGHWNIPAHKAVGDEIAKNLMK
jgi:hypothetical protein